MCARYIHRYRNRYLLSTMVYGLYSVPCVPGGWRAGPRGPPTSRSSLVRCALAAACSRTLACHQLVTRVRWASPQVCVVDVWVDVRRPRHERPRADPPARQPLPSALAFAPPSVGFASGNGNQLSPFTPLTPTDATKTRRASKQVLVNMPSAPPRVMQRMGEGGWVEGQGDGHAEHGWS